MCHTNNKNFDWTEIQDVLYAVQQITPNLEGYWNNKNKIHVTSNISKKHAYWKENRMSTESSSYFNISYFLYSMEWILSNICQDSHKQQTVNCYTLKQQVLNILSFWTCTHRSFNNHAFITIHIVIIGDSHAGGCAAEISRDLGKNLEVNGRVMPGARLEDITNLVDDEINKLGKNDVVIAIGGTNDVNKNETNVGLEHLRVLYTKGITQTIWL